MPMRKHPICERRSKKDYKHNKLVSLKSVRHIMGINNFNYIDTSFSSQAIGTAGGCTLLSSLAEGNDLNNRQGRGVKTDGFQFRLAVYAGTGATTVLRARFIIFIDKNGNTTAGGTLPAVGDVLTSPTIDSFYNLGGNQTRFKILYDKTVNVGVVTDQCGGKYLKGKRKMTHELWYSGTANGQTTAAKGGVYLIAITDGPIATNAVYYQGTTRIKYLGI